MPQYLRFFAEYGVLVHVPSPLFATLSRPVAQKGIRPLTAHNDKLGFDWRNVNGNWKFVVDKGSKQFVVSQYKDFINTAIGRLANYPEYKEILTELLKGFTEPVRGQTDFQYND